NIIKAISDFSLSKFVVENAFNDKIKSTLDWENIEFIDAKIRQLAVESNLELRKKRNSVIETVEILYRQGGEKEERSIDVVAKTSNIYEKRIYDFVKDLPIDCFLKLYDYVPKDKLILEPWCRKGFENFDKNTLDELFHHWNEQLNRTELSESTEINGRVQKERNSELKKLMHLVAEMHYYMTKKLFNSFDAEKIDNLDFTFNEGKENEWKLEVMTKQYYQEKFIDYVLHLAQTTIEDSELEKFHELLKEIIYHHEGEGDIFEWADAEPLVVVHGDLHPRQIVYIKVDGERKYKFVDLKNVRLGPAIIDSAFLQSPVYNCEDPLKSDLYSAYLDKLKDLCEDDETPVKRLLNLKIDYRDLRRADTIRRIHWNMRIADKISRYMEEYPYYERSFIKHLEYSKSHMEYFISGTWDDDYPQTRKLYDLFKTTIFKNVK
ncbi:hypothetical protein KY312_00290, partial [Candidatus Woesearchaeota archaeon]|nr:hypothetical protein [Candidatus Woesearchaeota archaeon]